MNLHRDFDYDYTDVDIRAEQRACRFRQPGMNERDPEWIDIEGQEDEEVDA